MPKLEKKSHWQTIGLITLLVIFSVLSLISMKTDTSNMYQALLIPLS